MVSWPQGPGVQVWSEGRDQAPEPQPILQRLVRLPASALATLGKGIGGPNHLCDLRSPEGRASLTISVGGARAAPHPSSVANSGLWEPSLPQPPAQAPPLAPQGPPRLIAAWTRCLLHLCLKGGPSSSWGIVADPGLRAQMLFPELQGPEKLPDAPKPVVPWEFPELRGRFPVPPAPAPPLGTTPLAQAPGRNLHVDQGPLQTKQAHASPASLLHDVTQGRAQNQRAAPGRAPPCRLWGPGR